VYFYNVYCYYWGIPESVVLLVRVKGLWVKLREIKYYIVIFNWAQGHSGLWVWCFRGGIGRVLLHSPPLKIAVPQSNSSGKKNCIKVYLLDVSRSCRVFAIEFCYEVWCWDIRGCLPRIVLSSKPVSAKLWRLRAQPRWLFRKNSVKFSIGLYNYLYKYPLVCAPISHNHMTFTNNYTYLI